MTEEEWLECRDPGSMVEFLRGKPKDRKLRLFGCACVRCVWLLTGEQAPSAVETAEEFADQMATKAALRRSRKELREERLKLYGAEPGTRLKWGANWLAESLATENAFGSIAAELQRLEDVQIIQTVDWRMTWKLLRDIFGNPFHPVALDPRWRTADVIGLARAIYEDRAFARMSILADALMDAGCADEQILGHCRSGVPHVRGCWVVDLVLGKE